MEDNIEQITEISEILNTLQQHQIDRLIVQQITKGCSTAREMKKKMIKLESSSDDT